MLGFGGYRQHARGHPGALGFNAAAMQEVRGFWLAPILADRHSGCVGFGLLRIERGDLRLQLRVPGFLLKGHSPDNLRLADAIGQRIRLQRLLDLKHVQLLPFAPFSLGRTPGGL